MTTDIHSSSEFLLQSVESTPIGVNDHAVQSDSRQQDLFLRFNQDEGLSVADVAFNRQLTIDQQTFRKRWVEEFKAADAFLMDPIRAHPPRSQTYPDYTAFLNDYYSKVD